MGKVSVLAAIAAKDLEIAAKIAAKNVEVEERREEVNDLEVELTAQVDMLNEADVELDLYAKRALRLDQIVALAAEFLRNDGLGLDLTPELMTEYDASLARTADRAQFLKEARAL